MPRDALDPGPEGDYPNVPRRPDGSVDRVRFPRGPATQRDPRTGERVPVDLTMRDPAGNEIAPDDEEG